MSPARRFLRVAAAVLLTLAHAGARADEAASGTEPRWHPAPALRSVGWPEVRSAALGHDPRWPVTLQVGRLTLVPVNAGDQVRIWGAAVYVGLASGTSETYPDAISWLGARPPGVVRVPTWSSARFLALRADAPTHVTLEIMARTGDPLREHRLDAAVYAWLGGESKQQPQPVSAAERRALDAVLGLRALLESADGSAPRSGGRARAALLHSHWLELRLAERRLADPYFVPEATLISGGRPVVPVSDEQDGREWRELGAPSEVSVHTADADVVSFAVRARAAGPSRVQIWSGSSLLHDLQLMIPRRAEGSERWTPARIARAAVHGERPLRIVVLEGAARVAAAGYRAEHGLLERAAAFRLRALAAELQPAGPAWLQDALALRASADDGTHLARLRALWSKPASDSRPRNELPPAASAATAALVLPALVGHEEFFPALASFWSGTGALPGAHRDALRAALLERLAAALPEPVVFPPQLSAPRVDASTASEAHPLLAGLLESVVRHEDGARPRALFDLERAVAERASDARLVDVAHDCWSRAAPWQALDAPNAIERTIVRQPESESSTALCEHQSERGLRWWIVPRVATDFEVLDLGGTHSSVRLSALDPGAAEGAEVLIDDLPVFVQPALGEDSRVALSPGVHRIQHRSGSAVIARVPRAGAAPCAQLVEMERWFALHGELAFPLPPGDAPTVASVIVDPSSLPKAGARLELLAGGSVTSGWLRAPASGDIEILVPPGVSELRVRSDQPLLLRARARAHPTARVELAALPPRERAAPDGALAELAALGVRIRAATHADERRQLRLRRAEIAFDLGYPELASVDALRAGASLQRRSLPGALFLPERAERVVPLGLAAQAPLLPLASPGAIERALELDRLGDSGRALRELVAERLHQETGGAALLSARLAAQTGDAALAAGIFERLAQATGSGGLFAAAAEQYDIVASSARSVEATERAFILAKLAVRAGVHMDALLARYAGSVEWTTPSLSSLGASAKNVAATARDRSSDPIGSRMRRALLSTPSDARQFGRETSFNVRRWRGQTLLVESLCFNREGPGERCAAELLVDGATARCELDAALADPTLATPERCSVPLSESASVLVVRLPEGARRMGWARLEAPGPEGGAPAPIVWQQAHAVVGAETPIRLELMGPSVLRVSARALGTQAAALEVLDLAVAAPGGEPRAARRVATLDFATSPSAAPAAGEFESISEPRELEYVVEAQGPHLLTLQALSGRLLVRPEIATVVSPPESEVELAEPGEPPSAQPAAPGAFDLGLTRVAPQRPRAPLSLSAELSLEDRDLAGSDSDRGTRYAQTGIVLRRGLLSEQLWLEGGAFARVRDGAPSAGVELASGLAVSGLRPGAFASARVVLQPAYGAVGASATFGLRQRAALGERVSLLPELGASWRRPDPRASIQPDVDGDVYSLYALRRAWSIDPKLVLLQRPFIDTIGRHELGLRVIPDAGGVDRVDARSDIDVLAGAGWMPWLGLGLGVSHRPSFAARQHAFTRWQLAPHATFWSWVGGDSRLRSDLDVSVFLDTPNPSGARAGVFASFVVAYDFLLGDGLGDFRPSARPFRARMEEGGPAPDAIEPPGDVYWRENAP